MKLLKKGFSLLLVAVMMLTTFFFADLGIDVSAFIGRGQLETSAAPTIKFYVPELIYTNPVMPTSDTYSVQYYVDSDSAGNLSSSPNKTSSQIYFACTSAVDNVSLAVQSGTVFTNIATPTTNSSQVKIWTLTTGTTSIRDGACKVTLTYTTEGKTYSVDSYIYFYYPNLDNLVGTVGSYVYKTSMGNEPKLAAFAFVTGVHKVGGGYSNYYDQYNTSSSKGEYGLSPLVGWSGIKSTDDNGYINDYGNVYNEGSGGVTNSAYVVANNGGIGGANRERSGDDTRDINGGGYAQLFVDTSRYSNYNQIPNLYGAWMVHNSFLSSDTHKMNTFNSTNGAISVATNVEFPTSEEGTQSHSQLYRLTGALPATDTNNTMRANFKFERSSSSCIDLNLMFGLNTYVVNKGALRNTLKDSIETGWGANTLTISGWSTAIGALRTAQATAYTMLGRPYASASDVSSALTALNTAMTNCQNLINANFNEGVDAEAYPRVRFIAPETIYLSNSDKKGFTFFYGTDTNGAAQVNPSTTSSALLYATGDGCTPTNIKITCGASSVDGSTTWTQINSSAISSINFGNGSQSGANAYSTGVSSTTGTVNTTVSSGSLAAAVAEGSYRFLRWTCAYTVEGKTYYTYAYTICYAPITAAVTAWAGSLNNVSCHSDAYAQIQMNLAGYNGNKSSATAGTNSTDGSTNDNNVAYGSCDLVVDTSRFTDYNAIPYLRAWWSNRAYRGDINSFSATPDSTSGVALASAPVTSGSAARAYVNFSSRYEKQNATCGASITINTTAVSKSQVRARYYAAVRECLQQSWYSDGYTQYQNSILTMAIQTGHPALSANSATANKSSLVRVVSTALNRHVGTNGKPLAVEKVNFNYGDNIFSYRESFPGYYYSTYYRQYGLFDYTEFLTNWGGTSTANGTSTVSPSEEQVTLVSNNNDCYTHTTGTNAALYQMPATVNTDYSLTFEAEISNPAQTIRPLIWGYLNSNTATQAVVLDCGRPVNKGYIAATFNSGDYDRLSVRYGHLGGGTDPVTSETRYMRISKGAVDSNTLSVFTSSTSAPGVSDTNDENGTVDYEVRNASNKSLLFTYKYIAEQYTVNYQPNSGTFNGTTGVTATTAVYDDNYTVGGAFSAPTRVGYTFAGWKLAHNNEIYTHGEVIEPWTFDLGANGAATTMTAQWTPNNYYMSFDNAFNITDIGNLIHDTGSDAYVDYATNTIEIPLYSGTSDYNELCSYAGGQPKVFIPVVSDHVYRLSFDVSSFKTTAGGQQATTDGKYGFIIMTYTDAEKNANEGYDTCWLGIDRQGLPIGNNKYEDFTIPSGDKWISITYRNFSSTARGTVWAAGDISHTIRLANVSVRDIGYKSGTANVPKHIIDAPSFNKKIVTYDAAMGAGDSLARTWPTVTRTGYTFAGWYTQPEGVGTAYTSTTIDTIPNDISVYSKWTVNTNKVTFNMDGGTTTVTQGSTNTSVSGTTTSFTGAYGSTLTMSLPAKRGYRFSEWALTRGANNTLSTVASSPTASSTYTFGEVNSAAANDTLKANWAINTSYVKFVMNGGTTTAGGTAISGDSTTKSGNYYTTLSIALPTKTGYTFTGWTLSQAANNSDSSITSSTTAASTYRFGQLHSTDSSNCDTLTAGWNPNTYYVRYNKGAGGTGAAYVQTCAYASNYSFCAIGTTGLTKTGYHFTEWDTAENGSGISYSAGAAFNNLVTTPNGYYDLHAQWEINTSKVRVNPVGGTATVTPQGAASEEITAATEYSRNYNTTLTLSVPTRLGYTFNGWAISAWGDANHTAAIASSLTGSSTFTFGQRNGTTVYDTLTAQWTRNTNRVLFVTNGGSVSVTGPDSTTRTITGNGTYVTGEYTQTLSIAVPTRTGYIFGGWSLTAGAGNSGSSISGNATSTNTYTYGTLNGTGTNDTLTANWTPITYSVVYKPGTGVTGNDYTQTCTYDVSTTFYALSSTNHAKTGYSFTGWNTAANGSGTAHAAGAVLSNLRNTNNATYNVYSQWTRNTYNITYVLNGGTVSPENPTTYHVETPTFTLNNPTKTGYTFAGWTGNGIAGASTNVTITVGSTGNRTYTATYTIHRHAVKFLLAGGSGITVAGSAVSEGTMIYGDYNTTLSIPSPTRTGYTFGGWSLTAGTGNSAATGRITNAATSTYVFGTLNNTGGTVYDTLTALWTNNKYNVIYAPNDTSANSSPVWNGSAFTANVTHTNGATFATQYAIGSAMYSAAPTMTGYNFSGWKLGATTYNHGASYTWNTAAAQTFTAQWSIINYSITCTLDGGTATNPTSYNINSAAITLNNPTKTGWTFTGWTGANGNTPQTAVNIPSGSTGNKAYTANWRINSYTLTVDPNGGSWVNGGTTYTNMTTVSQNYATTLNMKAPTRAGYTFTGWFLGAVDSTNNFVNTSNPKFGTMAADSNGWTPGNYTGASSPYGGESYYSYYKTGTESGNEFINVSYTPGQTSPTVANGISGTYNTATYARYSTPRLLTAAFTPVVGSTYTVSGRVRVNEITTGTLTLGLGTSTSTDSCLDYLQFTAATSGWQNFTLEGAAASTTALKFMAFMSTIENGQRLNYDLDDLVIIKTTGGSTTTVANYASKTADKTYTFGAGDDELVAGWQPNTYSIIFKANSGTGEDIIRDTLHSSTATYGGSIQTPSQSSTSGTGFNKTGYTLAGYSHSASATTATYGTAAAASVTTIATNASKLYDNNAQITLYAVWTSNKYNAVYYPNDPSASKNPVWSGAFTAAKTHTNGITYNSSYVVGSAYISAKPTLDGYTFTGWNTAENGSGTTYNHTSTAINPVTTTTNLNFYAQWQVITYNIDYELNGGSATNRNNYTVDTAAFTLNNPTRTGYTFAGWSGTGISGTSTEVTIPTGSMDNREYTANWTRNSHKVTFSMNGGTTTATPAGGSSQSVSNGTSISGEYNTTLSIAVPEKTGYTFAGWSLAYGDSNHTSAIASSTTAASTFTFGTRNSTTVVDTLTASWTAKKYNVVYAPNDISTAQNPTWNGTAFTSNRTHTNGATFDAAYTVGNAYVTAGVPLLTGYVFAGWSRASVGATPKYDGVDDNYTWNVASAQTFYANWTLQTYTITYNDMTGATNGQGNPATYTVEQLPITINAATKTGYTFNGWTGSNGNTAQTSFTIAAGTTGSKTYTANWTRNSHKVTFVMNDGTTSATPAGGTSQAVSNGTSISGEYGTTLTIAQPTRTGYTFNGWSLTYGDSNHTSAIVSNTVGNSTFTFGTRNSTTVVDTLTASWTNNKYDVIYAPNDVSTAQNPTWNGSAFTSNRTHTNGATYSASYNVGGAYIAAAPLLTGYTFTGWSLGSVGATPLYAHASTGSLTWNTASSQTFYANWTRNEYTITYNGMTGATNASTNPATYTVEQLPITIGAPSKPGYTFTGWTGSNGNTAQTSFAIAAGTTGNKTYTANWTQNSHSVLFYMAGGATTVTKPDSSTQAVSGNTTTINGFYGTTLTMSLPTRTGYTFAGWTLTYGDSNHTATRVSSTTGNSTFTFGTRDSDSVYDTMTATWTANKYNVIYAPNDISTASSPMWNGTAFTSNRTHTNGATFAAAYTVGNAYITGVPSMTGYTFDGWTRASAGSTPVYNGTTTTYTWNVASAQTFYANWTIQSYTISFDGLTPNPGHTATNTNVTSYTVEDLPLTLAAPTLAGYTFTGWSGSNGSTPATSVTIAAASTGSKSYTAHWTRHSHSVLFVMDGGTMTVTKPDSTTQAISGNTTKIAASYDQTITMSAPTRTGYTFSTWQLAVGTGNSSATGRLTNPTTLATYKFGTLNNTAGTVYDTLTAKWTSNTYDVTYYPNDVSDTQTPRWNSSDYTDALTDTNGATYNAAYAVGSDYVAAAPTMTGYTFDKWARGSANASEKYTHGQSINPWTYTSDQSFYATWTATQYAISYAGVDGATVSPANRTSYTIDTEDFTLTNPTKTGWTFTGWSGTGISGTSSAVTVAKGNSSARSYTANWSQNSYEVLIVTNGGSATVTPEGESAQTITNDTTKISGEYGTTLTIAAVPTKTGYTFTGWTLTFGDANHTATLTGTATTQNVYTYGTRDSDSVYDTLTAGWSANRYNVTYAPNDSSDAQNPAWNGTAFTDNRTHANGATYNSSYAVGTALATNAPTMTGYVFGGWKLGSTTYTHGQVISAWTLTADQTFIAQWQLASYNITYAGMTPASGHTATNNANNPAGYSVEDLPVAIAEPTLAGYTFVGWTGDNGETAQLTFSIPVNTTGNKTYTANWTRNSHRVNLVLAGGSTTVTQGLTTTPISGNAEVFTGEYTTQMSMSLPVRTGYTFVRWSLARGSGNTDSAIQSSTTSASTYTFGTLNDPSGATPDVLTAVWTANNVNYVVNHYVMDTAGQYPGTVTKTETKQGAADATLTLAELKDSTLEVAGGIAYFNGKVNGSTVSTTTIASDGSRVINLYYARTYYAVNITVVPSGKASVSGVGTNITTTGSANKYYGASVTLTATPASGYLWSKWTYTATSTDLSENNPYTFTMPAASVSYTANVSIETYHISYSGLTDATVSPANQTSYNVNSAPITLNNPTKTGYEFAGWTGSNGDTPQMSVTIATGSTGDKSYAATWSISAYSLEVTYFDYPGYGYDMSVYDSEPTASATWTGASGATSGTNAVSGNAEYGSTVTVTAAVPTGFHLMSWSVNDGSEPVTFANASNISTTFTMPAGDVSVHAQIEPNTYTIRYYPNNGSGNIDDTLLYYDVQFHPDFEQYLAANDGAFIRPGYSFLGWGTSSSATEPTYYAFEFMSAENAITTQHGVTIPLYAVWQANTYTVEYRRNGANGGAADNQQTECTYGQSYNYLPATTYTKTGYSFIGWNTAANGSGDAKTAGAPFSNLLTEANGRYVLYAQWSINSNYTVTFDRNGYSDVVAPATTGGIVYVGTNWTWPESYTGCTYGVDYNLPSNTDGTSKYFFVNNTSAQVRRYFLGWSTTAGSKTAQYAPGASFTVTADTTLYAVWSANYYALDAAVDSFQDSYFNYQAGTRVVNSVTGVTSAGTIVDGQLPAGSINPSYVDGSLWATRLENRGDYIDGKYTWIPGNLAAAGNDFTAATLTPVYAAYTDAVSAQIVNAVTASSANLLTDTTENNTTLAGYATSLGTGAGTPIAQLALKDVNLDVYYDLSGTCDDYTQQYTIPDDIYASLTGGSRTWPPCEYEADGVTLKYHSFNSVMALCDAIFAPFDDGTGRIEFYDEGTGEYLTTTNEECLYTTASVEALYIQVYGDAFLNPTGFYDEVYYSNGNLILKQPSQYYVETLTEKIANAYHDLLELKDADYTAFNAALDDYIQAIWGTPNGATLDRADLYSYFNEEEILTLMAFFNDVISAGETYAYPLKNVEQGYLDGELSDILYELVEALVPKEAVYNSIFALINDIPSDPMYEYNQYRYPSNDSGIVSNLNAWRTAYAVNGPGGAYDFTATRQVNVSGTNVTIGNYDIEFLTTNYTNERFDADYSLWEQYLTVDTNDATELAAFAVAIGMRSTSTKAQIEAEVRDRDSVNYLLWVIDEINWELAVFNQKSIDEIQGTTYKVGTYASNLQLAIEGLTLKEYSITFYLNFDSDNSQVVNDAGDIPVSGGIVTSNTMGGTPFSYNNKQVTFQPGTFVRDGYTFMGWSDNPGHNTTTMNPTYALDPITGRFNFTITEDVVLYAIWQVNENHILLDPNGGTFTSGTNPTQAREILLEYEAEYDLPVEPYGISRTGYTFDGWTVTNDETTVGNESSIVDGVLTMGNGNATITASWTPITYIVYFFDMETGEEGYQEIVYDEPTALDPIQFTVPDGYEFGYWTDENYVEMFEDEEVVLNLMSNQDDIYYMIAVWVPSAYNLSVTVSTGAATGTASATVDGVAESFTSGPVVYGSQVSISAVPATGYHFVGWTVTPSEVQPNPNTVADSEILMPAQSTIASAAFEANTYTVTFNGNGETSGTMSDETFIYNVNKELPTNNYVKTGSTFLGWSTTSSGTVEYGPNAVIGSANAITAVNADEVTLYAVWQKRFYTLTVNNANGTANGSVSLGYTDEYDLTQITTPTKTGYTFSRWELTTNIATPAASIAGNILTMGDGNATITAKYTANTFTVNFDGNGATGGSVQSITCTYDESPAKTAPANSFTKTGNSFVTWNTEANGTGTAYAVGSSLANICTGAEGDTSITLYAQWDVLSYDLTVTVLTNGTGTATATYTGQVTGVTTGTVKYGDNVVLDATPNTGYHFVTWTVIEGGMTLGSLTSASTTFTMPAVDATVRATFAINTYTVHFNGSNPTGGTMANQDFVYNVSETLTPNAFIKTGYTFLGWTKTSGSAVVQYADALAISSANALTQTHGVTVNLYAVWSHDSYTLTIKNANGTDDSSQELVYGETFYTTNITSPTKTGYTFNVWEITNDEAATTPASLNGIELVMGDGDAEITATYTANTYTVAFNGNGSTSGSVASIVCTYDDATKKAPANGFTKTGFTFTSWNTKQDGSGNTYAVGADLLNLRTGAAGDNSITLYAQWSVVSYDLTITVLTNGTGTATATYTGQATGVTAGSVEFNDTVTITATPNTGYHFVTWTVMNGGVDLASLTNASTTFTMPAVDVTVRATFAINSYNVHFSGNGNTGGSVMEDQDFIYNVFEDLRMNTYMRTGYTFIGWAKTSGAAVPEFLDGATIGSDNAVTDEHNVTVNLFAVWSQEEYTLTINFANDDDEVTHTLHYGDTFDTGTIDEPLKTGYTFTNNWQLTSAHATTAAEFNGAILTMGDGDATLMALYQPNTYTIVFDKNGGSGTQMLAQSCTYDAPSALPACSYIYAGYIFEGWNTLSAPTAENPGTLYEAGDTIINLCTGTVGDASITLYAQWGQGTFTITFDATLGTLATGESNSKTVVYGQTYGEGSSSTGTANYWPTVPVYTVTFSDNASFNAEFLGWFTGTQTDGVVTYDTLVTSDTTVSRLNNHTLYAKWADVSAISAKIEDAMSINLNHYTQESIEALDAVLGGVFTQAQTGDGVLTAQEMASYGSELTTAMSIGTTGGLELLNSGTATNPDYSDGAGPEINVFETTEKMSAELANATDYTYLFDSASEGTVKDNEEGLAELAESMGDISYVYPGKCYYTYHCYTNSTSPMLLVNIADLGVDGRVSYPVNAVMDTTGVNSSGLNRTRTGTVKPTGWMQYYQDGASTVTDRAADYEILNLQMASTAYEDICTYAGSKCGESDDFSYYKQSQYLVLKPTFDTRAGNTTKQYALYTFYAYDDSYISSTADSGRAADKSTLAGGYGQYLPENGGVDISTSANANTTPYHAVTIYVEYKNVMAEDAETGERRTDSGGQVAGTYNSTAGTTLQVYNKYTENDDDWLNKDFLYRNAAGAANDDWLQTVKSTDACKYVGNDNQYGQTDLGCFYRYIPNNEASVDAYYNAYDAAIAEGKTHAQATALAGTAATAVANAAINTLVDNGTLPTFVSSNPAVGDYISWAKTSTFAQCRIPARTRRDALVYVHLVDRWGNEYTNILRRDLLDVTLPGFASVQNGSITINEIGGSQINNIKISEYAFEGGPLVIANISPTSDISDYVWNVENNTLTVSGLDANEKYTLSVFDNAGNQQAINIRPASDGTFTMTIRDETMAAQYKPVLPGDETLDSETPTEVLAETDDQISIMSIETISADDAQATEKTIESKSELTQPLEADDADEQIIGEGEEAEVPEIYTFTLNEVYTVNLFVPAKDCDIVLKATLGGSIRAYIDNKLAHLENGKITVKAGSDVKLKVVVSTGYELTTLTMKYEDGTTVPLTGSYTTEITDNVTITAAFVKTQVFDTVTVVNGKINGRSSVQLSPYAIATVVAQQAPEGMVFAYWAQGSSDGSIVSYDEIYTFVVTADITLVAVYNDTAVEAKPSIMMDKASESHITQVNGNYTLAYTGKLTVPEGYTLVEFGLILSNQPADAYTDENFVIGSSINGVNTVKIPASTLTADGQCKINVNNVASDATRAGRLYMVYSDAQGNETLVYSDIWSVLTTPTAQ